jgi:YegS/Rv2252/BmrU family lipid kinase
VTATTRGYLVVANPEAGGTDDDVVREVHARLAAAGGRVTPAEGDDDALDAALRAADGDCVVAVGGDGSVHRVAARLHAVGRLDLDVGLVPLGTGNDLARGAGLPLDPLAAAEGLTRWPTRPIDLLAGNGRVVVNVVHLGLGAHAAETASRWKSRLGTLAYPLGAVVAGTWVSPWELRVTVDGRVVHDGMTVLTGIGNGRTIGGGTRIFPRARLDDGLADVVVATARYGRVGRAVFGHAMRAGRHGRLPWVRSARGRHVEVEGEPIAGNADGEIWSPARSWEVEVVPGALRLRRPPGAT